MELKSNNKALAALILGVFAMANVVLTALISVFWLDEFEDSGIWLLPPFLAFWTGLAAAYLGSIAWIDVRRGTADRRLREAQVGSILGGVAASLVLLAILGLTLIFILIMMAFGADGGGWD